MNSKRVKPPIKEPLCQPPHDLSGKQIQAAVLYSEGLVGLTRIAQACGVSRQRLYEWRQKPSFQKFVRDLQSEAVVEAKALLAAHAKTAAKALLGCLADKGPTRLKAAMTILDRTCGAVNTTQISMVQAAQQIPAGYMRALDALARETEES